MSEGNNPPAYVMQPTVGRIVHVRDATRGSGVSVGIITCVHGPACINVTVIPDCAGPYWLTSLSIIEPTALESHGWFWPPRA